MKEPVLVIMAAGMGSRYGGLKQIDPVDQEGIYPKHLWETPVASDKEYYREVTE